ncbi:MAG: 3-deoxy-D-manno-octulosonic acid transferase [Bacteroidetes bacterium]|nr:3-deoxy-D-manno-octulosonic acid transferase [Bacteroidota bacterium]
MAFYTFCIVAYHFIVKLLSPFNKKARLFSNGRIGILQHIDSKLKGDSSPKIWVHCASLGEFEQGRPVIEKLKTTFPNKKIVLTFFSPSGYELRKDYEFADYVFYLPADTKSNAKKFLQIINPELAIFVKYEFWLNYLNVLHSNKIPTLLISGIFREDQHFFKWYGGIFKRTLFYYEHLFLQNQESKKLLNEIGLTKCSFVGDSRFERVVEIARNPENFLSIQQFSENNIVIVAGSTYAEDEKYLVQSFISLKQKYTNLKLIIAPHNIENININQLVSIIESASTKLNYLKFSDKRANNNADILIIDNIGMLSSIYQYGKLAYIGGGFGSGIHNILEAITYGIPVVFGPNYKKFNEALACVQIGISFSFVEQKVLNEILEELITNDSKREQIKVECKNYISSNLGSVDKILKHIQNALTN